MSYQVNFLDNQVVTAEELNKLTKELGGAVGSFQDNMVYGVDALNQISQSLIQKGVSRGCQLSAKDGSVMIGPGVLYMADGKRVEIDDEGITLSYTPGTKHYVWFMQNSQLSFVVPQCTDTKPEGDGCVLLGEVLENGEIGGHADKAVMKHEFLGMNHTETHTISYEWNSTRLLERLAAEIELQHVGYRYLIAYCDDYSEASIKHHCFCGFVDLRSGLAYSILTADGSGDSFEMGFPQAVNQTGTLAVGFFPAIAWRYCYGYIRAELRTDNVLRIYQSGRETSIARSTNSIPTQINIKLILC